MLRATLPLLILLSECCSCGRILFATISETNSHIWSMLPFANRLAANGHRVGFYLETKSQKVDLPPPIQTYILNFSSSSPRGPDPELAKKLAWNMPSFPPVPLFLPFYVLNQPHRNLIKMQRDDFSKFANQSWDLLIVDAYFCTSGIDLALSNGAPYASMAVSVVMHYTSRKRSLGRSYATAIPLISHLNIDHWDSGRFVHRIVSAVYYLCFDAALEIIETIINYSILSSPFTLQKYVDNSEVDFHDSLLDHHFQPSPISTQIISVEDQCSQPEILTGPLETFVNDKASKGTILIGFGSVLSWKFAPTYITEAMIEAVEEFGDYRVIWAYDGPQFTPPANVKLVSWMPQKQLLYHEKTALFLTHGGLKSVKDALCAQVPLLIMPMFSDQIKTAWLAESLGFGTILHKRKITKRYIVSAMRGMLNENLRYGQKAFRAKRILLDRVVPPMDEGVHAVNKILKHKGLPLDKYYRIKQKQYAMQYLLLDILIINLVLCFTLSHY